MFATLNEEEMLIEWGNNTKLFSTVDLTRYGLDNHYLRALRTMRELAKEGKFRRIPDDEAVLRSLIRKGNALIAWYETV